MADNSETNKKGAEKGRPLDISLNKLIIEATLELLPQMGFQALTTDAIAQKAGVGKAAIYRRWASKKELVLEAVISANPFENVFGKHAFRDDNKSLRDQLVDLLCFCFLDKNEVYHHALVALAAAFPRSENMEKGLQQDFSRNLRSAIESIIKPFLRSEFNEEKLNLLTDLSQALIVYRVILMKATFDEEYIISIVDNMMIPMLQDVIDN